MARLITNLNDAGALTGTELAWVERMELPFKTTLQDIANLNAGSEINDLTAIVTWANVPLANIPSLPASQTTSGEFAKARIRRMKVADTRAVDDAPNAFDQEVLFDFKTRTTLTPDPPGTDTFVGLMTFAPWRDTSGGPNYQLVFSNTADVPTLAVRTGDHGPLGSDWGNWKELAFLDTNWAAGDIVSAL